jgi:hypothetical protein
MYWSVYNKSLSGKTKMNRFVCKFIKDETTSQTGGDESE